jgi:Nif-specific regulatory protein
MESLKDRIKEMEREEIINALKGCDWIMARAAKKLGITERMIGYKVKKYGIRTREVRWFNIKQEDAKGSDEREEEK